MLLVSFGLKEDSLSGTVQAPRDEGGEDVGGAEVMSASNICDRGGSDIPILALFGS